MVDDLQSTTDILYDLQHDTTMSSHQTNPLSHLHSIANWPKHPFFYDVLSFPCHRTGNMKVAVSSVTALAHSMIASKALSFMVLYYGINPNIASSFELFGVRTIRQAKEKTITSQPFQLLEGSIEVRVWRFGDESAIQSLLRQSLPASSSSSSSSSLSPSFFDPEGPVETDCGSREALLESYSTSTDDYDGGCFLVAEFVSDDGNDDNYDTNIPSRRPAQIRSPTTVVGTAGLILGTQVQYLSSGSSYSTPTKVTGAIRRVCCTSPPSTRGSSYLSMVSSTSEHDQSTILKAMLLEVEARARQKGATELILLAYPQRYTTSLMARPTPKLVSELGYQPQGRLDVPLRGGDGIETIQQYYKVLKYDDSVFHIKRSIATTTAETTGAIGSSRFVSPVGGIVVFFLSSILAFAIGVANLLGLEVSPVGSSDNRGIGIPLSQEELYKLQQDETLQRTDLDGNAGPVASVDTDASIRAWDDLTDEERREEAALMKIIQGQDVRIRSQD
jgi:hypothetical protein